MPPSAARVTPHAYGIMRQVEDAHWWFDAMETITARLLEQGGGRAVRDVLDAGCGTGRNLAFLERRYGTEGATVTGVDYSPVALGHCRARGFRRLVCGSVNALPMRPGTFDLVTSFDVVTAGTVDDAAAFAEMARVLRPEGRLLIRVAAYDWLRGHHDQEWAIARRYHRPGLRAKLEAAGFEVLRASYANMWLLPAALLKRLAERWAPPDGENSDLQIGAGKSLSGRLLQAILASEARAVAGKRGLPCGLSLFALARKSPDR